MGTHTYAPVGRCIYCGKSGAQLGAEHIIPFSLNGGLILPKASCRACEKVIQKYEFTVARRIFGHFRIKYGVQTRNKVQRPTHVDFGTLYPDGRRGRSRVPVHEYPTMLFVYKFDKAAILEGRPPQPEDFRWVPMSICSSDELNKFKEKHFWDGETEIFTAPIQMARLLAKIAYSYAIAEIGLESFTPLPMTIDTILCRTDNVSYSVGGEWEIPPPDPAGRHLLTIFSLVQQPIAQIIVVIRLFPFFETPSYHVVVGHFDLKNPKHVQTFMKNRRDAQPVEIPLSIGKRLP